MAKVLGGPDRHLRLAVLGPHPRPGDLDAAATQRDHAVVAAVPVAEQIRVVPARRTANGK